MDTWGDVTGVTVVIAMIWVGWLVARAAWREMPGNARDRDAVVDLRRAEAPRG